MDLDNLISEYVSKTTEELELYRASLLGQYGMQNGIPEARVAAINSILANRTSSEEEEQVEEVKEIDDYLIAVKYVNKNKSSARRGISFELSFNEYKRILKKEKVFLYRRNSKQRRKPSSLLYYRQKEPVARLY